MKSLSGIISDRLRALLGSGDITPGDMNPQRQKEAPPRASSVRHAKGHGLGKGATRKRDGKGDATHG